MRIIEISGPRASGKTLAGLGLILQHLSSLGKKDELGELNRFNVVNGSIWSNQRTNSLDQRFPGFNGEQAMLLDDCMNPESPMDTEFVKTMIQNADAGLRYISVERQHREPVKVCLPDLIIITRQDQKATGLTFKVLREGR
jgi:hypothetical protein